MADTALHGHGTVVIAQSPCGNRAEAEPIEVSCHAHLRPNASVPEVCSLGHISDHGARSEICGNVVANNYFRASVFSRNLFRIAGHAYIGSPTGSLKI